jgi:hypothetical protein
MSEKIFLTYTNATAVPHQGSVLGHHVVLNYVDKNGAHHMLQGVPSGGVLGRIAALAGIDQPNPSQPASPDDGLLEFMRGRPMR